MGNADRRKLIQAARERIYQPFGHHFEPIDYCGRGAITLPSCFERGLGEEKYDCSGLVIASLCDVIGMPVKQWPSDLRHLNQMSRLSEANTAIPGDILIYLYYTEGRTVYRHMGVLATEGSVVHASQFSKQVEETNDPRYLEVTRVIPLTKMLDTIQAEE